MNRAAIAIDLLVSFMLLDAAHAQMGPGPVNFGKGAACYNPVTGEIIVSMNGAEIWYIESASGSLTGATPIFPPSPLGLNTDNDGRIGQGDFAFEFTFTDHSLGRVAAIGLPLRDLVVVWNPNPGGSISMLAPVMLCVPEPAGLGFVAGGAAMLALRQRRRDCR